MAPLSITPKALTRIYYANKLVINLLVKTQNAEFKGMFLLCKHVKFDTLLSQIKKILENKIRTL